MAKARILVVEDNRIVAKDIQQSLEVLGYTVFKIVPSGEAAIEVAKEGKPDLILMDINLKGEMDGTEAAEQIKQQFSIPIIYLTAYSDDDVLEKAKITEPFGYLIKPFDDRELSTTIEIALYKHKMERKLQKAHDELELKVKKRTIELKEINSALTIVLRKSQEEKNELEEKVLLNMKGLIRPFINALKNSPLDNEQISLLNIIESNLTKIVSPFSRALSLKFSNLTPREIQIASLIRDGKTSKEIAELIASNKNAVEFHKTNLRKKLGLRNEKKNLRSHLLSLY